ncbi:MAG: PHP domain-containing protein, partial [Bdellovibrionales bacterium]|nr:PHP domain-containing protein [Bdellovibrionales bacterium]
MLVDLHIHSVFSDGDMAIPEIIDLYGQRGFGAIAITDHVCESQTLIGGFARAFNLSVTPNSFDFYHDLIESENERAKKLYGMMVIPGVELSKNSIRNDRSAHILALGIQKYISADGSIREICDSIHAQGGIAIAAHPVNTRVSEKQTYSLWNHRDDFAKYFDAWEVASGKHIFSEVMSSELPIVANSDLHRRHQLE